MTTALQTEYLTADGEIFDPNAEYFVWWSDTAGILSTKGLEQVGGVLVDSNEYDQQSVPIGQLHRSRDSAIESGQKAILRQIEQLKTLIETLENEKTPKARTLKYRLQARQH